MSRSKSRSRSRGGSRSRSRGGSRSRSQSNQKGKSLSKNDKPLSKTGKSLQKTGNDTTALLIIDMQNDFLSGGSLAVPGGNRIIHKINKLRNIYKTVVLSKDWHPKNHVSFALTHKKPLFSIVKLPDGTQQMLWPVHCVKGSSGSKLHRDLVTKESDIIIKKGTNLNVDAYSAFFDNSGSKNNATKLDKILKEKGISKVDVCGLAYDYCVGYTALDAKKLGYDVRVIKIATAAVNRNSENEMTEKLKKANIKIIDKNTK